MSLKKGIVLSGGGMKGIIMVGSLLYLAREKGESFNEYTYFVGVSIGSILAFLLAIGIPPVKVYTKLVLEESDWYPDRPSVLSIFTSKSQLGLIDINRVIDPLREWVGLDSITFKTVLEQFGHTLIMVSLDMTTGKECVYSPSTTPEMDCFDALGKSANIPIVFTGNQDAITRHWITDGGLVNNFPVSFLPSDCDSSIGILVYEVPVPGAHLDRGLYLGRCLNFPMYQMMKQDMYFIPKTMTLYDLPCHDTEDFLHEPSKEKIQSWINHGYQWTYRIDSATFTVIDRH